MAESKRQPIGPAHAKLGEQLRQLQESRHRTGRDLKAATGVSTGHISEIKSGLVTPTRDALLRLVRELGGSRNMFLGLLAAAQREHEEYQRRMKERRDGIVTGADLGFVQNENISPDRPIVEIVDDENGDSCVVEPGIASPHDLNFYGPHAIEEIDELHYVNANRILFKSIYNRKIRVVEPGFRVYPFAFGETPPESMIVSRFQIGVRPPFRVEQVLQMGALAYKVDLGLPEPLEVGDVCDVSITKIIEADGYCDPFIGGASPREMKQARIAVSFEEGFEPEHVWWFQNLAPHTAPGLFSVDRELKQRWTGQYEMLFTDIKPAMMLGIAWDYGLV